MEMDTDTQTNKDEMFNQLQKNHDDADASLLKNFLTKNSEVLCQIHETKTELSVL